MAAVAGAALLAGCSEPLLTDNEPRSQFDRYDAVRQQRPPSYVENEFGEQRPNIRGRILGGG